MNNEYHINVIQDLNLIIAKILEDGYKERHAQEYFKRVHDRKICVKVWIE